MTLGHNHVLRQAHFRSVTEHQLCSSLSLERMRDDWDTARVSYVVLDEADQMLAPMKGWLRSPEDTDGYKQVTKEHSVNVYCVELVLDCECYARRTSVPLLHRQNRCDPFTCGSCSRNAVT